MVRKYRPEILLFVPNIIGYIRFGFTLSFVTLFNWYPNLALLVYLISAVLDFFDGYLARKLGQTSKFGAQLDVVVDIIGRGFLWVFCSPFLFSISCLEWCVFVATSNNGTFWKDTFSNAPPLVAKVMANNFRTYTGSVAVAGLDFLPIYLLYIKVNAIIIFPISIHLFMILVFILGRCLAMYVELFIFINHIKNLLID